MCVARTLRHCFLSCCVLVYVSHHRLCGRPGRRIEGRAGSARTMPFARTHAYALTHVYTLAHVYALTHAGTDTGPSTDCARRARTHDGVRAVARATSGRCRVTCPRMSAHMSAHMSVHTSVCAHMSVHMSASMCMSLHTSTPMSVHTPTHPYPHTCLCKRPHTCPHTSRTAMAARATSGRCPTSLALGWAV